MLTVIPHLVNLVFVNALCMQHLLSFVKPYRNLFHALLGPVIFVL